jgi:hypothetical protein
MPVNAVVAMREDAMEVWNKKYAHDPDTAVTKLILGEQAFQASKADGKAGSIIPSFHDTSHRSSKRAYDEVLKQSIATGFVTTKTAGVNRDLVKIPRACEVRITCDMDPWLMARLFSREPHTVLLEGDWRRCPPVTLPSSATKLVFKENFREYFPHPNLHEVRIQGCDDVDPEECYKNLHVPKSVTTIEFENYEEAQGGWLFCYKIHHQIQHVRAKKINRELMPDAPSLFIQFEHIDEDEYDYENIGELMDCLEEDDLLMHLELEGSIDLDMTTLVLPPALKSCVLRDIHFTFSECETMTIIYPPTLERLEVEGHTALLSGTFPDGIEWLKWTCTENSSYHERTERIALPTPLPKNLKVLEIHDSLTELGVDLPESVHTVIVGPGFNQTLSKNVTIKRQSRK